MPEVQIEMSWACSTCHTKNRGREMACTNCGKPKGDEEYEMPEDIQTAPVIETPELLRKAKAGPNWKCRYCNSEQRRLGGVCAQCGSDQTESTDRRVTAEKDPFRSAGTKPEYPEESSSLAPMSSDPPSVSTNFFWKHPQACITVAGIAGLVGLLLWIFWPHNVDTRVQAVSWNHVVHVERYKARHHDGFDEDRPGSAFNVQALGERYHHSDHVLDHYETVSYTYQEACGEDCRPSCTTTPRSCTSNKNGFATCTGGDQICTSSCTTRYCSKIGQRQEPRYVDIPRTRMYYAWDNWEWGAERNVAASGTTMETNWPDPKLCGTSDLSTCNGGEQERGTNRTASYKVVFQGEDKEHQTFDRTPSNLGDFERFQPGSRWRVRVDNAGIIHSVEPIP